MRDFRSRAQFHDEGRLQAIIAAVREEEQAKSAALIEAAKTIVRCARRYDTGFYGGKSSSTVDRTCREPSCPLAVPR